MDENDAPAATEADLAPILARIPAEWGKRISCGPGANAVSRADAHCGGGVCTHRTSRCTWRSVPHSGESCRQPRSSVTAVAAPSRTDSDTGGVVPCGVASAGYGFSQM